jgi:hypothetical protein
MSKIHRWRKVLWIALGLAGLLGLGGVGMKWLFADAINQTINLTPQEFSDWVKLQIPSTAQNWKAYGEGFQDWYILARFELPAEELPAFLKANGLVPAPLDEPPEDVLNLSWFRPKAPLEVYELMSSDTKQASTASGFYPTVYVELAGPTVVLYIVAFDT